MKPLLLLIAILAMGFGGQPVSAQIPPMAGDTDTLKEFVELKARALKDRGSNQPPRPVDFGERISSINETDWVQADGVVTFAGPTTKGALLEIVSHGHRVTVHSLSVTGAELAGLLHREIHLEGVAQGGYRANGERAFIAVWVNGFAGVRLGEPAPQDWISRPQISIAHIIQSGASTNPPAIPVGSLIHVAGTVTDTDDNGGCEIEDETGRMQVICSRDQVLNPGARVEAFGLLVVREAKPMLACAFFRVPLSETNALPLLTTVEQVQRLKPEEAARNYPVRIRGVATGGNIYLQDSTRGISMSDAWNKMIFGSYYEVEGTTGPGLYAPVILPAKFTYLGPGELPDPIHPTWGYLASGSAVCQWLELQSLVLSTTSNWLTLAIPGGRVEAEIRGAKQPNLDALVNHIVRIRGTCRLEYNLRRQITRFWISVPSIAFICDELPASSDPFVATTRTIAEILQFDVDAHQIRRIKVDGRVIYHAGLMGYLSDGTNGLKYSLQSRGLLLPGDRLELVGFPDTRDFLPVLRESLWRKKGRDPLPIPRLQTYAELSSGEFNSSRVRVRGRVLAANIEPAETMLTLLIQSNAVTARVQMSADLTAPPVLVGSLVDVVGVCAGRSPPNSSERVANAFELLVQSRNDISILERPSWWTFRHSLEVISTLGIVLLLALGWIHLLRTKVAERTRQLRAQMQETERVERKRALEQERSRIARDLHDNLGACLTEISMLAETGQRSPDDADTRFSQILARGQMLVHTLDETVWAVDPTKDTLPSLVRYLAAYAEEFVSTSGISCRVEVPATLPDLPLTTELRHDLFLATKESLNNAVRHARPNEIQFQLHISATEIQIQIADDGRGFDLQNQSDGNGLRNLRERMARAGRRCEIRSAPGQGTTVLLAVALSDKEFAPPA